MAWPGPRFPDSLRVSGYFQAVPIRPKPFSEIRGSRVFVYRNLHQDCWSVKATTGSRRVVAHADRVDLSDVEFRVNEKGRQRVLRDQAKNVHAGVVGTLEGMVPRGMAKFPSRTYTVEGAPDSAQIAPVTYNPYRYETFVIRGSEEPIETAERAVLEPNKEVWAHLTPADGAKAPPRSPSSSPRT